jgi:hypothetical protein
MGTRCRGEDGAALELALIFLGAIALIITALLSFASTSSQATVVTRTTRSNDYDADAAMQTAIATIRVDSTEGYVGSCLPGGFVPSLTLNNPSRPIRVDCTPFSAPSAQRHVVLSVCSTSVAAPCPDAQALLRADVTFYDDQSFGRAVSIQSWSNQ